MPVPNEIRFEIFALEMMMALPSCLNISWAKATKEELATVIERNLDDLAISPEARDKAREIVAMMSPLRSFYRGVGKSLTDDVYGGSEPHPVPEDARRILEAMRALDREDRQKPVADAPEK